MTNDIAPEVVERMIAFVRGVAGDGFSPHAFEASRIVALLPEPVDGDLVEARRIAVCELNSEDQSVVLIERIQAGDCDHYSEVRIALAAIKRGRALEKEAGR